MKIIEVTAPIDLPQRIIYFTFNFVLILLWDVKFEESITKSITSLRSYFSWYPNVVHFPPDKPDPAKSNPRTSKRGKKSLR